MTVKELIKALKDMPQDMEVLYEYYEINSAERVVVPGYNLERVVLSDSSVEETAHIN